MPDLFGLDIAGMVNDALTSAGGLVPGALLRAQEADTGHGQIRDPDNPTAGLAVSSPVQIATFQGFLERVTSTRRTGTAVVVAGEYVSILGASVTPMTVPLVGDVVQIEGHPFKLLELSDRDPAAALYTFKVS